MSQSIVIAAAATADLDPAPITPGWILSGAPDARAKLLAISQDKTSSIVAWECTPGLFNWHYAEDESVCIISGEVYITSGDGAERRLGQGDMAFFPAGSSCTWRVTERIRKVAFLRKDMPHLLGFGVRAWHKLLRTAGIRGQMQLTAASAGDPGAARSSGNVVSAEGRLRPGDLVELRSPEEIAETLDGEGALDHLPFMPEMLESYGRRFRVARRALTVCYYGPEFGRRFHNDNVVTLEGVRCSGAAHDGCKKGCLVFWNEAWLRKADGKRPPPEVDRQGIESLRSRLKVASGADTYYCQASELLTATFPLTRLGRWARYFSGFRAGNFNIVEMTISVATFLYLRFRRKIFGAYPRGNGKKLRDEALNLQPGEWVEVKPFESIVATLNERGHNRGLSFTPDMRHWCGRRLQVRARLDKVIADGTGQMKSFRDTVCLEGSTCGCACVGPGMAGCARNEFTYWREAWLRRCDPAQASSAAE